MNTLPVGATIALYQGAIDTLNEAFFALDRDGGLLFWNQRFAAMMGHPALRPGVPLLEIWQPESDRPNMADFVQRGWADGATTTETYDLDWVLHQWHGQVWGGDRPGLAVMGRDLSHLRRAEEAWRLALSEALGITAILDNLADGLMVVDSQGWIARCNPALLSMVGRTDALPLGDDVSSLPIAGLTALIAQVEAQPEQTLTVEVTLPNQRVGQAVASSVYRKGIGVVGDMRVGTAVLIRDITHEREVLQMKSAFLSTVAHELRTPLASVLGFTALVRDRLVESIWPLLPPGHGKLQHKLEQNLTVVMAEAERLTALVDDVLDEAKMAVGKFAWQMETLALQEVLERAIAATTSLFENRPVVLQTDMAADLGTLTGDRNRLIQVVVNLIGNAVKFTPEGSIACCAYRQGDRAIVEVRDTGIGIAPENCARVLKSLNRCRTRAPPKAPAWVWPSANTSWRTTGAKFGSPAAWGKAAPLPSRCPIPKVNDAASLS
ncbi:MAG: PAS domain-containing sensor histidine kinase [Oscillatoriales cyanobacterium SM2_1_8]|nr:PAS domain-containing sensor histidine kinase [Oscillatoriales cyanobacterium SM2_1_8]